jgi:surface antigen
MFRKLSIIGVAALATTGTSAAADAKPTLRVEHAGASLVVRVAGASRAACTVKAPTGVLRLRLDRRGRRTASVAAPSRAGRHVVSVRCRRGRRTASTSTSVLVARPRPTGSAPAAPPPASPAPDAGVAAPATPSATDEPQSTATLIDEGPPADDGYGAGAPYYDGQCTRYAWNLRQDLPGNLGNAETWDERAAAQGFPVDRSPRAGDVAVWERYTYGASWAGHVAYVELVHGNGMIRISEWNWRGPWIRTVRDIWPGPLRFIHRKGGVPPQAPPLAAGLGGQFPMDGAGVVHITQDDRVPVGFNVAFSEAWRGSFVLRPESGPIGQLIRFSGDRYGGGDFPGALGYDSRTGFYRADVVAPPTMVGDHFMRWNTIDTATGRNGRLQPSFTARIYPAARFTGPHDVTITSDRELVELKVVNGSGRVWRRRQDNLHFVDPAGHDLRYPYQPCASEPRWIDGTAIAFEEETVGRGQTATYLVPICRHAGYRGTATLRFDFVREGVAHYRPLHVLRITFA